MGWSDSRRATSSSTARVSAPAATCRFCAPRSAWSSNATTQRRAALATGLTSAQATRHIILPQALRRMLPSLVSQSIIAFQDSTIASVIGVTDVFQMTNIISAREQRPIELYTGLAAMFFVLCYALSKAVRALEARTSARVAGAALP
jgi:ABC-type amino acid transport system permease subunit